MRRTENEAALLDLIKQNPDLPVIPMVYGEVVAGDDFSTYMGAFGSSHIGEYAIFCERVYFNREEFAEDVYYKYDDKLNECINDDEKIDDFLTDLAEKAFRPAIIVYITDPSDSSDFDVEYYLEKLSD